MGKITENTGSRKARQMLFSQAGEIAVRRAQNKKLPLTYASGNQVIRESPDGKKIVIAVIQENSTKIPKKFVIK